MDRLARFADAVGRITARFVPSAFSIAVLLTGVTFVLALGWAGAGLTDTLRAWGGGFWELLSFSMQMVLVMFTGYLLALCSPVRRLLEAVASLAKTPRSAVALMAFASMALAYFNWGLSIVASAMLVRFVARRQPGVDYRLLVACAFFGLGATWHAGLSASAPLLVATPGHFLESKIGTLTIDQTLFSSFNLTLVAVVVVLLTALAFVLHPPPGRTVRVDPALLEKMGEFVPPTPVKDGSFSAWIDHARILNWVLGGAGVVWFAMHLISAGWRKLDINTVNFLFLSLAIVLHRSPAALLKAAEEASGVLGGIVLQFPLYAGIYGIFKSTGLATRIGEAFVSLCTAKTFPVVVYWYSGIVNYFVPSGGSKWGIEAPYLLEAAARLNVPVEKVVLAYAWGDMATDLIQPFWALPLLAVARLEFKDILGFLFLVFAVYLPVVSAAFFWFL